METKNILNSNPPNFIQILYGISNKIISKNEITKFLTKRTNQLNKPLLYIKPSELIEEEIKFEQKINNEKKINDDILSEKFAKLDTTWKERENGKFIPSEFQKGILDHIQKQRNLCGHKIGLIVLATFVVD